LIQAAQEENLRAIYLFSTGAGAYWTRIGFKQVTVGELVEKLLNSPQVKLFEKLGWLPGEIAFKYSISDS
jgi:N-acetylglutamate synthase-like GNAT family acetyltransferase